METIIIIPARMASSRFPGKPLARINGLPMIQRVWQQAMFSEIGDVYVACSEKEVYDLIQSLGGKAILTDPNLPSGTDRVFSAFQKINNKKKIDNIINLQGDMPLIKPQQISKVLEPLKYNYSIATLATDLTNDQINNKNITKVEVEWLKENIGIAKDFFRQKENKVKLTYHHVGIYSYNIDALEKFVNTPKSKNEISLNLEQFRALDSNISIGITYVPEIPISIDTKEDLTNAENIIRESNEKNQ